MSIPDLARWLVATRGQLRQQAVRGGIWLIAGEAASAVATLLKFGVLGRLLTPGDFGLVAVAMISLKWLEYFTETGFKAALIQRPGDIDGYLDTAWTVQVLRGVALSAGLFIGAPFAAAFFGRPDDATAVIRAICAVIILKALANPAVVYLRRELDFRREVGWHLSGVIASLIAAVAAAWFYPSVWALVLSAVIGQAAESAVSFWIRPYAPRWCFDRVRARELMQFGKWIFSINVVAFLVMYIDSIAVGRLLGVGALGFYQMAERVAFLPTAQIGTQVRGVIFPAFAKLREVRDRRRAFLQTLGLVAAVVIPSGCFMTVFAPAVVQVMLGGQWGPVVPALQILTWAGVAKALTGTASSMCLAAGRPDLPVRVSVLSVVVTALMLVPLIHAFEFTGAAIAVAAASTTAGVYQFTLAARLTKTLASDIVKTLRAGVLGALPLLFAGWIVSWPVSIGVAAAAGGAVIVSLVIVGTSVGRHIRARSA